MSRHSAGDLHTPSKTSAKQEDWNSLDLHLENINKPEYQFGGDDT